MNRKRDSLALGVMLMAAGCAAPQAAGPPQVAQEQQPKYGGVLSVTNESDPFDFDMSYGGKTTTNSESIALVYESLLAFKNGPEIKHTEAVLLPELAERWEVSPDARAFTFHLKKGVRFPDEGPVNGRELISPDVKWSYQYWSRSGQFVEKKLPPSQIDFMFEGLDAVETPDAYTAVVRFKEPFSPFLSYTASNWNPIVPKEIYEADGHLKNRMAGTGPFRLNVEASQKGTRWMFEKNSAYRDPGRPYLNQIRRLVLADDATERAAFQTQQLDILGSGRSGADYNDAMELKKAMPSAVVQEFLQPKGYHLYFTGARRGPFDDVRVRRAFALAIDRDEMNRVMSGGRGAWAATGAWPGLFTDEETRQLMRHDPDEARRLLREASFPFDWVLEWTNVIESKVANETIIPLVQSQLSKIGVKSELKLIPRAIQRQRKYAGDYDLDMDFATGALEADFDSLLFGGYYSKSALNWSHLNDPELDKLLFAQRQETDAAKRRELHRTVVRRIVDQAWGVDIIFPVKAAVIQPYVRNYYAHFARHDTPVHVWLDK